MNVIRWLAVALGGAAVLAVVVIATLIRHCPAIDAVGCH